MDSTFASLIVGLVGAIIGASASIATVWIQGKVQDRRERLKLVTELALEDYKIRLQHGKPGTKIVPVSLFIDFHVRLSRELEKGPLTPERYETICGENDMMLRKMEEMANSQANG